MLDRSDSPWYSTLKLYRQTIRDDWDSVFDQLAADVANLKADTEPESATALLQIPGSIGELFDKITILEIKAARIKDSGKLQHFRHELELLRGLQAKYGPSNDEQAYLVTELKSVNEALWDIEDDIRDCERRQDFGEEFISLARSIYKTNDRRAAIKKRNQHPARVNNRRRKEPWGHKVAMEQSLSRGVALDRGMNLAPFRVAIKSRRCSRRKWPRSTTRR